MANQPEQPEQLLRYVHASYGDSYWEAKSVTICGLHGPLVVRGPTEEFVREVLEKYEAAALIRMTGACV